MAAKKSAKKTSRKSAAKSKGGRKKPGKARKAGASLAPKPVKTGSGPAPIEVAQAVAALLRSGKAEEVETKWLAPSLESVEGVGASMAWSGKRAVLAKYRAWEADHDVHGMTVDGPWVGATGFALRFSVDATQ
jgi:hypothetical protein